ncbi:MAG: ATPase inhibitor subunit zeta [Caulobacteraceae bacterium]
MGAADPARRPRALYPRLVTNGRPQIEVLGLERRRFQDVYHRLLTLSWWRFFLLWVCIYLGANLIFAVLYWIQPGGVLNARPWSFEDAFFFSVQTLGTIGYGTMSPHSTFANLLVTAEAFSSLALTAVGTGLIFARVSRPTARVMFSRHAVVTPRNGVPTLMFRAANVRSNQILEAEVSVNLARTVNTLEGISYRGFYNLQMVRSRSPLFALSWTVMHVIDENSPLYGADHESLIAEQAELIIVLSGADETFAQRIYARHSYLPHEVLWDQSFADILTMDEEGRRVIDYGRFHDLMPVGAERGPFASGSESQDPSTNEPTRHMTTFDDREHAFEAHFAFEQELDFKVHAKRDRLAGLWAGGLMGLKDVELENYVLSLVRADLREAGDHDVYEKVLSDLADKGVDILPQAVRDQMDLFLAQARSDLGVD